MEGTECNKWMEFSRILIFIISLFLAFGILLIFFSLHVGLAPIFMTLAEFNSIINKLSLIDRASLLFVFFCLSLWIWRKSCYLLNLKSLRSATSWFLGACQNFWCLNLLVFQLQIFLWLFIVFYFVAKTRHIEGWLIPFISKNSLQAVKELEILHISFLHEYNILLSFSLNI